jgi:hypothetical protein
MINAWKKQAINKLSTIFEQKSDVDHVPPPIDAQRPKAFAKNPVL